METKIVVPPDWWFHLDDAACGYTQFDVNGRFYLDWVGQDKYCLSDVVVGVSAKLKGEHELMVQQDIALLIHVDSLEEFDPAVVLGKDLVCCAETLEVWLCEVDCHAHYKLLESWDNKASAHEPGKATMKVILLPEYMAQLL